MNAGLDPRQRAGLTKRARTEAALIHAATEDIGYYGYSRSNLDEVAKIAGVSPATLYNHFETKAMLGCAVLDHACAGALPRLPSQENGMTLEAALLTMRSTRDVYSGIGAALFSRICETRLSSQHILPITFEAIRPAIAERIGDNSTTVGEAFDIAAPFMVVELFPSSMMPQNHAQMALAAIEALANMKR